MFVRSIEQRQAMKIAESFQATLHSCSGANSADFLRNVDYRPRAHAADCFMSII
jgi:hypothetical protein